MGWGRGPPFLDDLEYRDCIAKWGAEPGEPVARELVGLELSEVPVLAADAGVFVGVMTELV